MKNDPRLNGLDYLMLGFDHELRRHGFAGNSCQIVLELDTAITPEALQHRLAKLAQQFPVLNAKIAGWFKPKWKLPRGNPIAPQVCVHDENADVRQKILNTPLAIQRGELMRFDLVRRAHGRMDVVFNWTHALMDALAAEHFLAAVGDEKSNLLGTDSPPHRAGLSLFQRIKSGWKNLHQLDDFCKRPPRSLGHRQKGAPPQLFVHVEKFSGEETTRIRANATRYCGILGDAQFHATSSLMELHRLHQRLYHPSPSYVLPVPVGLRTKGGLENLFSNQVGMLMIQFFPENLDSLADAIAYLKTQTVQAMRDGLLESGLILSELFRFLPLPVFAAALKRGLRGEICSLFFGDTAVVNPRLENFLGATVRDCTHVAAVTPSPGIGTIFYYFRGELRLTVVHAATVLSRAEAVEFAAGLRHRLLNP
ncbi:MAG TPA: hypothetical protein VHG71_01625 [Verrucomicrobiae bacterium]|nr:hypothetical protein [Verrucomicrobiae bacterium]